MLLKNKFTVVQNILLTNLPYKKNHHKPCQCLNVCFWTVCDLGKGYPEGQGSPSCMPMWNTDHSALCTGVNNITINGHLNITKVWPILKVLHPEYYSTNNPNAKSATPACPVPQLGFFAKGQYHKIDYCSYVIMCHYSIKKPL